MSHDVRLDMTGVRRIEAPVYESVLRSASSYWREDVMETGREVDDDEDDAQGGTMMSLLFSLDHYSALETLNRQLRSGKLPFAFLDDICVICLLDSIGVVDTLFWRHIVETRLDPDTRKKKISGIKSAVREEST